MAVQSTQISRRANNQAYPTVFKRALQLCATSEGPSVGFAALAIDAEV